MASHESLIELIFSKLSLVYGRDFLARWEGQNLMEVKADWMRELAPSLSHPTAIKYALEHLPERAPNVVQFRALCIGRPEPELPQLPAPAATDAVVQKVVSGALAMSNGEGDPKNWAFRLRKREWEGDRLTITQRAMWRAALGASAGANA